MLNFIMSLVLILGIIVWLFAVAEFFIFNADPLFTLFLLILGGQLVKLAYAFCESEDQDKKHNSIMAAIKQVKNRF